MIVVYDPSHSSFTILDYAPDINHISKIGFMMFKGCIREVVDIHYTNSGIQIELFKIWH